MKSLTLRSLSLASVLLACGLLSAEPTPPPAADLQEFVFLAEARPVLVRLHVQTDGKSYQAAWDDFIQSEFVRLDKNKDGVLNKTEAEHVLPPTQLLGGGLAIFSGASKVTMKELVGDKKDKVTLDELKAYYRTKKFASFQFQLNMNPPDPLAQIAYLGGSRPDPSVDAVSKATFALLDTNKDGKLTRDELLAAQAVLLTRDENEDEALTPQEIVPDTKPAGNAMRGMMAMPGGKKNASAGESFLLPILTTGKAPADLMRHALARYGSNGKDKTKKLSRKDLGLDEATFAALDADKDGTLDDKEMSTFVKRAPDLCLTIRFGDANPNATLLDLSKVDGRPTLLADRVQRQDDVALLDLGKTRLELRRSDEKKKNSVLLSILRPQLIELFKAADKNGDGYVDEKEAKDNPQFSALYKGVARDGKGKISEKEMLSYFDAMQELQKRARAACVTLTLRDQSRGIFELLDLNRDGKLSLRELRQAPKLLERFASPGKDYLGKDDIPHAYALTLRRGAAENDGQGAQEAVFERIYGGGYTQEEATTTRGPAWFRKMDRNRDGDLSRKEFLFSEEQFRKLDTDGDGLISVEEATAAKK